MPEFDPKRVERSKEKFKELLERHGSDALRTLLTETGTRFYACPASNKGNLHGCYEGGLVEHTISVFNLMINFNTLLKTEFKEKKLFKVAVLHDFGKIGDVKADYYLPQDDDSNGLWRKNTLQEIYKINPAMVAIPVSVRSLYWTSRFGIKVTPEETQAITSQVRFYVPFEQNVVHNKEELTLITNWSDYWSSEVLKI